MPQNFGLFVGINNYGHREWNLRGCVNDAEGWSRIYGKYCSRSYTLLDGDATRKNILDALRELISQMTRLDYLVFTFSGHGTWTPDRNQDEADGRDEALCPVDMERHLILDDELGDIFASKPPGYNKILFISDACHSGTVMRAVPQRLRYHRDRTAKYVSPNQLMYSIDDSVMHEMDTFRVARRVASGVNARSRSQSEDIALPGVIHFSACKDGQFAYDTDFGNKYWGALSYYMQTTLLQFKDVPISYREWARQFSRYLPSSDLPQTPRLNCTRNARGWRALKTGNL